MARELHLIWMIFCVHLIGFSSQQETGFIYKRFGETGHGVAKGLLKLTDGSRVKMGHTFFKNPFIVYLERKWYNKDGLVRKRGFREVNRGTPIETRRERRRKERKNRK
ncbi:hypothetical protein AXX17_AT3G39300 [Arabidopsis thaliana]|uniref:Transmembrane protein n=1 Tax=Arabidopsis thaliana TaxID=3702 RepID=A0A178VHC0_ARATH|nr:hypothetical protein AXX17_AT3G39300 [Arabidopsis thaliana]